MFNTIRVMQKTFLKEFFLFLKEYKVVPLAVAFVMGGAVTGLVNSLVKDILLPIAGPLMSAAKWQDAVFTVGPITLSYGSFLAELVNFLILAFVVFIVVKKIMKTEDAKK